MTTAIEVDRAPCWLPADQFDCLLDALRADGRTIIGPTIQGDAIVLDEIDLRERPAGRAGGRGVGRPVPTHRTRRSAAVRPRGRTDVLEAMDLSAARPDQGRDAICGGSALRGSHAGRDTARVHRRPRLRAGSDRHPGPCVPRPAGGGRRLPGSARLRLHRRCRMRDAYVDLLLHVDGHRSRGDGRLRRRPDRARRWIRRADGISRGGRAYRVARTRTRRRFRHPGRGRGRRRCATGDGHPDRHVRRPGGPRRIARPSRLGRRRGALPLVHELHPRLSDLLLHERGPEIRSRRGDLDIGADLEFVLRGWLCAGGRWIVPARAQGPLPAMADPQVLDVVGPVRLERLRRMRPVHRLVPGRHRRTRGARRSSRERGRSRCRSSGPSRLHRRRSRHRFRPPWRCPRGRRRRVPACAPAWLYRRLGRLRRLTSSSPPT